MTEKNTPFRRRIKLFSIKGRLASLTFKLKAQKGYKHNPAEIMYFVLSESYHWGPLPYKHERRHDYSKHLQGVSVLFASLKLSNMKFEQVTFAYLLSHFKSHLYFLKQIFQTIFSFSPCLAPPSIQHLSFHLNNPSLDIAFQSIPYEVWPLYPLTKGLSIMLLPDSCQAGALLSSQMLSLANLHVLH